MVYELIQERIEQKRKVRTYRNGHGLETKTTPLYTTPDGSLWWGFVDLRKVPYIRLAYAKNILDLFSIGLSLKDILDWCNQEKVLLKSEDPEKYEKLYALILDKESIARNTADPIRQHLALCSVYVLSDEEKVDYFDEVEADNKMKQWLQDPGAVAFFLSWHNEHIQNSLSRLEKISKTVSALTNP